MPGGAGVAWYRLGESTITWHGATVWKSNGDYFHDDLFRRMPVE